MQKKKPSKNDNNKTEKGKIPNKFPPKNKVDPSIDPSGNDPHEGPTKTP